MKRSTHYALLFATALCATYNIGRAKEPSPSVLVSTSVDWMTPFSPEINLLLRNQSSRSVNFVVMPAAPFTSYDSNMPMCSGNESQPSFDSISHPFYFYRPLREDFLNRGVIPSKGWTHRTLRVGGNGSYSCNFLIWVLSYDNGENPEILWQGNVKIPKGFPSAQSSSISKHEPASLKLSTFVERDKFSNHVLLRTLVENSGANSEYIRVSDRQLECKGDARADWSTHFPVPMGADIGPAKLEANSWVVFVNSIRLVKGESFSQCRARIELSSYVDGSLVRVGEITASLTPIGFFDIGIDGIPITLPQ